MLFRLRLIVVTGLMATIAGLAGCSSTMPGPRTPVATHPPLEVDGQAHLPINFPGLVITIEPEKLLGYHFEGAGLSKVHDYRWGPNFSEETPELNNDVLVVLRQAGYRTVPSPLNDEKNRPSPGEDQLQLSASFNLLEYNSFSTSGGYYQAYCEVAWELSRIGHGTVLFSKRTAGYGKKDENTSGVIRQAFEGALKNLLAEEDFATAAAIP